MIFQQLFCKFAENYAASMFKKSIIKKFTLLYMIVGFSSLSLIGFYSYIKAKNALILRATEQLNTVKSIKKNQVESYLKNISINDINYNELSNILWDTTQNEGLGKSGEVYIVGNDFVLKTRSRFNPSNNQTIKAETESVKSAFKNGNGTIVAADYRNVLCLSSFAKLNIDSLNWVIVAEIDYDEAMIPIKNLRNDLFFLSILVLVLILSVAQVITQDIILPIMKLKNAAVKIGQGNFDAKVDIKTENEFGLLSTTFNQMIDDIQKNTVELLDEKTKRISALYDGQEFERHRISRDLHDGLAQQLIAVKMTLENIINRNELNNETKINQLKQQINSSIDELRKISYDLAPAGILEFSIENALANLCNQVQNNSNLQVDFSAFGNFSNLKQRTKIYLYRIVQEAIANTIKHAEAKQLLIQLTETNSHIVLMIEDNGKGFDLNTTNLGLGKGLFNMRERSILLNGTFDVETFPEKGTTIRIKINKAQQI